MNVPRIGIQTHDPHQIFLRRALRLAVAFPLTMFIVWLVFGMSEGSVLYGAFACFSTTTMLDLGGRMRARVAAYAGTLVACCVAIVLATAVGFSIWAAVVGTFVWGALATYAGLLRGYVASAVPLALVPWFLAISTLDNLPNLDENLVSWIVGYLIASSFALLLWPVRLQDKVRAALSEVLAAVAEYVEVRWVDRADDLTDATARLGAADAALDRRIKGVLIRPGGATRHERHRMQLVGVVKELTLLVQRYPDRDESLASPDMDLAQACARSLRDSALCVLTTHGAHVRPDVIALNQERERHWERAIQWMREELTPDTAESVVRRANNLKTLRATSGYCVLAASHARGSVGDDPRFIGMGTLDGKPFNVAPPTPTVGAAFRSNLDPRSVWFQNSVRAGSAFALAVLVILVTGVEHGFWVALGVLVALRFDASGSMRTVRQVLVGTLVGFVVGSILIAVAQDSPSAMWWLLALSVALATYTPGATTLMLGQASFTVFLIVLFGLLAPDEFETATDRVIDVALACSVTFIVSALMWPGGAASLVRSSMRTSANAAGEYLRAAYHRLAVGGQADADVDSAAREAGDEYLRATENFDLATASRVPGGMPPGLWVRASNGVAGMLIGSQKVTYYGQVLHPGHLCPDAAAALDEQAGLEAKAFVTSVHRACGLTADGSMPRMSDERVLDPLSRCLARTVSEPGSRLTRQQAARALTMIFALGTLDQLDASRAEIAAWTPEHEKV
ncbi:MAG: FUSC family protein [Candidatus Nanopelagicales bacterium]|nr:FUSC family protein [Candidatus Nanopelagicales bacterium]MDZ4249808.1 FUSC family protein [Candidatus Nanopelagicales bacterium]